jgi:hypothetical protein
MRSVPDTMPGRRGAVFDQNVVTGAAGRSRL